MIVTTDEVLRSLSGTAALLNRRAEGLKSFDMSERGFWHSFGAIFLTLPAFVVGVTFARYRAGLLQPGGVILDASALTWLVAAGYLACFLTLPLSMIVIMRKLGLGSRYVPFVVVTNWSVAVELTILAVPAALLLIGWATPALAMLYAIACAAIVFRLLWFATKATLGVSNGFAIAVVLFALMVQILIAGTVGALAG